MIPTLEQVQAAYKATGLIPCPYTVDSRRPDEHDGLRARKGEACALGALYHERFGRFASCTTEACDALDVDYQFAVGFDDGCHDFSDWPLGDLSAEALEAYEAGHAIGLAMCPAQGVTRFPLPGRMDNA